MTLCVFFTFKTEYFKYFHLIKRKNFRSVFGLAGHSLRGKQLKRVSVRLISKLKFLVISFCPKTKTNVSRLRVRITWPPNDLSSCSNIFFAIERLIF